MAIEAKDKALWSDIYSIRMVLKPAFFSNYLTLSYRVNFTVLRIKVIPYTLKDMNYP